MVAALDEGAYSESAAAAVQRLDRERELFRQLGNRAIERVTTDFLWDISVQRWIEAFEYVLTVAPRAEGGLLPKRSSVGRLERIGVPSSLIDLILEVSIGFLQRLRSPGYLGFQLPCISAQLLVCFEELFGGQIESTLE